tara:strand:- start:2036 stop:2899 length:864 start_codon:yes stop_codon:yes gene_type:complete
MPVSSNTSNFYNQIEIEERHVNLKLDSPNSEIESNIPQSLHGTLDLTSYLFPDPENLEITMYVYYNKANSEISHPLGKVSEFNGDIGPISLTDIDFITENETIYTLKVDIYISDKNTWRVHGAIRNISLKFSTTSNSQQTTENFIGVSHEDLGQIPWTLAFENEDKVTLIINTKGPTYQEYKDRIALHIINKCEIQRRLTENIINGPGDPISIDMAETTTWKVYFIHMLKSLLDIESSDSMKTQLSDLYNGNLDAKEEFINTVVQKFANAEQVTTLINRSIGQLEED